MAKAKDKEKKKEGEEKKSILHDYIATKMPLIWVYSREENRLLQEEVSHIISRGMAQGVYVYDATNTIYDYGKKIVGGGSPLEVDSVVAAIETFAAPATGDYETFVVDGQSTWNFHDTGFPEKSILVMLDVANWMTDPSRVKHTNAQIARVMKNSIGLMLAQSKQIIVVDHTDNVPIELEHDVTFVEHKLPSTSVMKRVVKSSQGALRLNGVPPIELEEDEIDSVAKQLTGLTKTQAENVLALANRENAIECRASDGAATRRFKREVIRTEKARMVQKNGILKIINPDWGMDEVGGMENLKEWANQRAICFRHEARENGIDLPKGLCVVGPGGTGKSWVAQALGNEWQRTVLKLDIGACMGSFLGESEGRIIRALADVEAQAPCILFVDEKRICPRKTSLIAGTSDMDCQTISSQAA